MRKISFFSLAVLLLLGNGLFAQSTNPLKIDKKVPVTGNENFDILFTRSVMISNLDSSRFDATRSGGYSLGIGYGVPLGKSLLLKFEPRVTWFKLYFNGDQEQKWYPSTDTSATLIYEKQRASYLEVPVSFKFKLARNLVDRYKLLLEAGFVFGHRLASTYKTRHYSSIDTLGNVKGPKVTVKTNSIQNLSQYRFGPFVRFGTNWLSLYGFYRMSDLFRPERKFVETSGSQRPYPSFPKLEVGITIAL
jgi:hypothetical protein